MKEHILMVVAVLVMVFSTAEGHAQSTTLKLPTSDSASNFAVLDSGNNTLFNVMADRNIAANGNFTNTLGSGGSFLIKDSTYNYLSLPQSTGLMGVGRNVTSPRAQLEIGGTDGLLCTGTINTGTVRALGGGVRMHWYPRRGAFRVGMAESSYWDDDGTTTSKMGLYSVGMGYQPRATGAGSTAIGAYNWATGDYALALGSYSRATASHAIAIGTQAYATGIYSIALGAGADTNGKDGAVVIGDDTYFQTAYASNDNQLTMRFSGGYSDDDSGAPDYVAGQRKAYRFWTSYPDSTAGVYMNHGDNSWRSYCSRDLKENFAPVDGEEILGKIRDLPITQWNYKAADPSVKFIGPVAEDFWDAFRLGGTDNKGINGFAIDGVNMAGVKALERRSSGMKAEMARMQTEIDQLKAELSALKAQLAALMPRLAAK